MSYLRFVPATQIHHIETDPEDYETELRCAQAPSSAASTLEPKWWLGPDNPAAWEVSSNGTLPPLMLHFAVNRPIGATRGERADLAHCELAVHSQSAGTPSSAGR